jgi:hypothetical protein
VIGLDPGRVNIFYMVTILPDGKIMTFVLTRKQYYNDSGINNAKRQSNTWNLGVKVQLEALSHASSKGCSIVAHNHFVDAHLQTRDALWEEYLRPRWARQRLSLYGGKKRVFAKFFNNVEEQIKAAAPGFNIVVAYGSAKFASGGPNEVSVPTSRAYKECGFRFDLVVTPEFRSTKVDCYDDSTLQHVAVKTTPRRALRGVLWNVLRREFVSRDLNAALNIRRFLISRPPILRRELATGKLVQKIVKRIKPR